MDQPRTVRVTLTYGNTLTEGVGDGVLQLLQLRATHDNIPQNCLNPAMKGYTNVQREGPGNQASSLPT